MSFNFITNIEVCRQFIDQSPELIRFVYYSHIPTALTALLISLFVYFKKRELLRAKILLLIAVLFQLWVIFDIFLWISTDSRVIMFFWSLLGLISSLLYLACLYFTYLFIEKKDISLYKKIFLLVLILPVIILTPTTYNIAEFEVMSCQPIENIYFVNYYHLLGLFIFGWILVLILRTIKKKESEEKKEAVLLGLGIELFLFAFLFTSYLASYLINQGIVQDYRIEQLGLFGMPVFVGFLGYAIVKYKTFNIKILGTQALVIVIWIILFSKLLTPSSIEEKIVDIFVFVISVPFGILLIRSVIKEVKLAEQQYEMVATVSHQLRTPLTPVLGYAAMMDQGDFDGHPEELKDAQHRLLLSTQRLRNIINDFLQMFELEGEHKMDLTKTPLQDIVNEAMAGVKDNYDQKKLYLKLENPNNVNPILVGETKLLIQAINNLLDNAQRYTIEGGSTVHLSVEKNRAIIRVTDTGIGLDENDKERLFTKFYRSDAAKEVRPDGSGLGLPIVRTVVEAHGGKVHAESEGRGKGTTFIIELPLKKN